MNDKLSRLLSLYTIIIAVLVPQAEARGLQSGLLAQGTPHETHYYVQHAEQPGPTVLILGGIHGNEPAGAHAVDVVRFWPITRGTVITVPRANVTALAAKTRAIPNAQPGQSQLNRAFPKPHANSEDNPEYPLAADLWKLVRTHRPEWIFDCHEGFGLHKTNVNSIGNSITSDGKSDTSALIEVMLTEINSGMEIEERHFVKQPGPLVSGSLVRSASDHLNAKTMLLATSIKDQRIPIRARQHRQMLYAALSHLKMVNSTVTPDTLFTHLCDQETIHVAIFDDDGVGGIGREKVECDLDQRPDYRTVRVDGHDIRNGGCDQFQVLVFSGGIGSTQARSLKEEGCQRVQRFVEEGGIYVGICAGAYLASSGKGYCLGLLDMRTKSPLWMRGRSELKVELTPSGKQVFAVEGAAERPILYVNGPVWEAANREDLADAEILAWYRTEIAKNGTPEGIQVDSPALILGKFGEGVAVAFSCHPEQTANCEDFVYRAIEAARSQEPVEAGQK